MKRRKVVAEVVEAGNCRYFRKGTKFVLGGFTPAGLCDSAYTVLSSDARVLGYGGVLPWAKKGKVLTRCPDPHGTLWQLRLANDSDIDPATSAAAERCCKDGKASNCYEVNVCRGMEGSCPFTLVDKPELCDEIIRVVKKSAWGQAAASRKGNGSSHCKQLRIALAACPNACTQPQIKDVGIIANVMPRQIGASCNGCGRCEEVCQKEAIKIKDDRAKVLPQQCVGCGLCIRECPQEAIKSDGVRFRILVGGTMGRHPKWGQELCVVDGSSVAIVVDGFLKIIAHCAKTDERIAAVTEKIGATKL